MTKRIVKTANQIGTLLAATAIASSLSQLSNLARADEITTADLVFSPRWYIGHRSSGIGVDGFTFIDGFVPLGQNPNRDLTFLNSRVSLDNSFNLEGSMLLGYRTYSPDDDRVSGGYFAYDIRDTGQSVFHQLGVGVSSVGDIWDFHLHGYVPLGSPRRLTAEHAVDVGLQPAGTPSFQGNSLILPATNVTVQTQDFETALSGVDAEIGTRLAKFSNGGDVRAYAGLHVYSASGTADSWGGSLRLAARPNDNLYLSLGVQEDEFTGTHVLFNVRLRLPTGSSTPTLDPTSNVARLAEPVELRSGVRVISQTESEIFREQVQLIATNPDTQNPYQFQHVHLNSGSGNGAFESPFETLEAALAIAAPDDIIYVQSDADGMLSGFTVPDDIWVLSTGAEQYIDTVELSTVQLPLSGLGQLPTVTDTVFLGNNTVLSGFSLSTPNGPGIEASDVRNIAVLNNSITGTRNYGILLRNVDGPVHLENNRITNTRGATANFNIVNLADSSFPSGQGIAVIHDEAGNDMDLRIVGNYLENNTNQGILLFNVNGDVEITANEILNTNGFEFGISGDSPLFFSTPDFPTGQGLLFINTAGSVERLAIARNVIDQNASQGILLANIVGGQVEVTENIITNTSGISLGLSNFPAGQGFVLANPFPGDVDLTVSNGNRISENDDDGILVFLGSAAGMGSADRMTTADIVISDNLIENNGEAENSSGDGIGILLEDDARVNRLTISDNAITNNGDDGIDIRTGFISSTVSSLLPISMDSNAQVTNAQITGNTIDLPPNSRQSGVRLGAHQSTGLQATIKNNQISGGQTGVEAILFPNTASDRAAELCLHVQNNQSSESGFEFANPGMGTFQISNLPSIRTDNSGEVRIGAGITPGKADAAPCL